MKKEWLRPEVKSLVAKNTNEIQTKDFPDYWACNGCGKHYISICEPKSACERCGSTDGYTFTRGNGDAVTLPNFNGTPIPDSIPKS